jgi:hypothetical protein
MGAGVSRDTVEQTIRNSTVNETINNNFQENINKIINTAAQKAENNQQIRVSDITCGGDVEIGDINQSIVLVQDMEALQKSYQTADVTNMARSALDAAQKNALDNIDNPNFEPFVGLKETSVKQTMINDIRNKVENNTIIKNLHEEFNTQIQEASNMQAQQVSDIVCGKNFKLGNLNQSIQASQIAKKMSETIASAIASTATTIDTKVTTDNKAATKDEGMAGVFKSISSIVDSFMSGPKMLSMVGAIVCVVFIIAAAIGGIFMFRSFNSTVVAVTSDVGSTANAVTSNVGNTTTSLSSSVVDLANTDAGKIAAQEAVKAAAMSANPSLAVTGAMSGMKGGGFKLLLQKLFG